MTLQEAIESLTDFRRQESALLGNEFAQATALGIEALKRVGDCRTGSAADVELPLPGETQDTDETP